MDGSTEAKEEDSAAGKSTKVSGEVTASNQDGLLRENMVDLATRFLTNNRVQTSPMEQRRAFLKKKGLTDAEINKAVQIAQQQGVLVLASNQNPAGTSPTAPPPLPPRPLAPPPQQRSWSEYAVMVAVVGGVGYAVVYFIRHYLIPWCQSPRIQEQRLECIQSSVDQLQSSITETVTSVNQSTQAIRDLLSEQQQHLQLLSTQLSTMQTTLSQQAAGGVAVKEVKDELGSLKGLLLSRHQFPPTPSRQSSQGGIPSWQRVQMQPSATPNGQKTPQQNGLNPSSANSSTESSPTAINGASSSSTASGMNVENPAGVSSHTPGRIRIQTDADVSSHTPRCIETDAGVSSHTPGRIQADFGEEWHDADAD